MDDLSDFLCRRTNPRIMSEKRDEPDGQDEVISGIFSELRSIWALKTAQLPPPQIAIQPQAMFGIEKVRGGSEAQLNFRVSRAVINDSPALTR